MKFFKKLYWKLGSKRRAKQRVLQLQLELERKGQEVIDMGFTKKLDSLYLQKLNPALNISCAIELANTYNLSFHHGIAPIIASLHKDFWLNEINLSVPAGNYGSFFQDETDEEKKKRKVISGYGTTVEEAVCSCLIYARNAGVL